MATAALLAGVVSCASPTGGTSPEAGEAASVPTPSLHDETADTSSDVEAAGVGVDVTADQRGEVVRVVGVVDGDTLRVSVEGTTERLRIIGIDAPELSYDECHAQAAASKMQSLVQSKEVRIEADPTQDDRDRYGRLLRHVWTLDDVNVAHELVAAGLAKEYTYDRAYAGQAEYRAAELRAQQERLGLWGACDGGEERGDLGTAPTTPPPTSQQPGPVPLVPQHTEDPGAGTCDIKGNISRNSGERIYHVPGQRHYDQTEIDLSAGERWFCSEQEAQDAGWRKAKV